MLFDFKASHAHALVLIDKLKENPRDIEALQALSNNMEEYAKNLHSATIYTINTEIPKTDMYAIIQKNDGKYHMLNKYHVFYDKVESVEQSMEHINKCWEKEASADPNADWLKFVCKPIPVKVTFSPIEDNTNLVDLVPPMIILPEKEEEKKNRGIWGPVIC